MSSHLWKYYLEDDVESFCALLEAAAVTGRTQAPGNNNAGQVGLLGTSVGSPGALSSSPNVSTSFRSASGWNTGVPSTEARFQGITISRFDINRRDPKGLTLLHYAASSTSENAIPFAMALLTHSLIDLYVQDFENGWTALHRAFYFGNITIARAIIDRDTKDAAGHNNTFATQAGTLIKIKDKEGNGPYDLLTETIKDRALHQGQKRHSRRVSDDDDDYEAMLGDENESNSKKAGKVNPLISIQGDELFSFGSNKNHTLGFNDEDDRQRPERVVLKRPDHLYRRFHREHIESLISQCASTNPTYAEKLQSELANHMSVSELPSVVRSRPVIIQDVQMSKFHTAVLTADPESNLYMCGYGHGGRLGTGNENTQFNFTCIEGGGLASKQVMAVSLGQNHTLAISDDGDIFSWGSNTFGQLGYVLAKANPFDQEPIQVLPRQIYGPMKREVIIGIAASRIHSVAHTTTSLYTFGKNEGQLGIVDSDARSLDIQTIPRKVAASLFSSPIHSVSAIDRATVCLLENHEVWVFANYGWIKPQIPLDSFTNYFLKSSFLTTKYNDSPNQICKITSGGDTICALSSAGEVYTAVVNQPTETGLLNNSSTTNPNKIKSTLTIPNRVWSLKKVRMNARDVAVDEDGSIILSTEAGSVWRRVRRPKIKTTAGTNSKGTKLKDFKFTRIPSLTRVLAVRASAFGAYCAIRKDCDVTRSQITVDDSTLCYNTFSLLPFRDLPKEETSDTENPRPVFWKTYTDLELLAYALLQSEDLEQELEEFLQRSDISNSSCDMFIGTTLSDVRIPIHQFIFSARSSIIRNAMAEFRKTEYTSIPDLLSIHAGDDGRPLILFQGLDFLTIMNIVLYIYTDTHVSVWQDLKRAKSSAYRYRQVRTELMKVSSRLELRSLETATRRVVSTVESSLCSDFELAFADPTFFQDGDVILQLADKDVAAHSIFLSRRCPFFEGLFEGKADGAWIADRRDHQQNKSDAVTVDLQHIDWHTFQLVLRHIYADTGTELFDQVITDDREEFIDLVMDVLSVANELMLDRLSQICQQVLGRYVTVRNACQLLNAVAPSAITEFKTCCLEYMCLSLESIMANHYLDELDEDVLLELDGVVRANQLNALPTAKSNFAEISLLERHPELAAEIDRNRQTRLDALVLQAKYHSGLPAFNSSLAEHEQYEMPSGLRRNRRTRASPRISQGPQSPVLKGRKSIGDMIFNMDDETAEFTRDRDHASANTTPLTSPALDAFQSPNLGALDSQNASYSALDSANLTTPLSQTQLLGDPALAVSRSPLTFERSVTAWGTSSTTSGKLDLKDIMAQASSSRVPTLSSGLSTQTKIDETNGGTFATRMSQKERRKNRKEQQRPDLMWQPEPSGAIISSRPRDSPWKVVSNQPKAPTRALEIPTNQPLSPSPSPKVTQSFTTPQLTMRQTVAKSGPTSKKKTSSDINTQQQGQRSLSSPQISNSPAPNKKTMFGSAQSPRHDGPGMAADASTPVPIQSIRHYPRLGSDSSPLPSNANQSLADILSQQQAEKVAIKDAVAKRSLQEIQQEQEFQEWWDQESRKVIEEQEARATGGTRAGDRGRGRATGTGRTFGRGRRGRGKEKRIDTEA